MKENIISDIETMARDYDNVEKMIAQCAHLAVDAIKTKLYKSRTVANSAQANYTAIYNCFNLIVFMTDVISEIAETCCQKINRHYYNLW